MNTSQQNRYPAGVTYMLATWLIISTYSTCHATQALKSEWTIIGAGPAGIAVVGLLLDFKVPPEEIVWIDPEFNVGRLGKHYANVPGNAKTEAYIRYIESCTEFNCFPSSARDLLYTYDRRSEYRLSVIIEPLKDITDHLCGKVRTISSTVNALDYSDKHWNVETNSHERIHSTKVVLATGCHPKILHYPVKEEIPLDKALDKQQLKHYVKTSDTIAVIGGSHSGILVVKNLFELGTRRIINFFKHPLMYAFDTGNNNKLYINGLKGPVGRWAHLILEQHMPQNIIRVKNNKQARDQWLPACNKIIYAIGYERNDIPCIVSVDTYDHSTGVIAPHLYGIGIAFPEKIPNQLGQHEQLIGLIDFIEYALKIMPDWVKTKCVSCKALQDIFEIVRWS